MPGVDSNCAQGPVRKKQQGRGFKKPVTSELTSAQCPHASPSPQREHSPVLFTQHDQRPSAAASDMILFGASDNEMDDSLSLAASDAEELSGSVTDPTLLPSSASRNARLRADEELIRVMTKAVNEPRMVSAWAAIAQQAGLVVSPGAPSSPPPTLVPLLP